MTYKICKKCEKEKPATLEYFHAKKDTPDGLCLYCKECISKKSKAYHQKNRDKLVAKSKAYYDENREALCAQKRQYRKDNPELLKVQGKKYREKNKETVAQRKQRYHFANRERILKYLENYRNDPVNKEKHKAYCSAYSKINRARLRKIELFKNKKLSAVKKGLPATFTPEEWRQCKDFFNHACAYCGKSDVKLEQEHFVPETKGGGYEKCNIIPACRACNQKKFNKDFFNWYPTFEHYSKARETKVLEYINSQREVKQTYESHEKAYG